MSPALNPIVFFSFHFFSVRIVSGWSDLLIQWLFANLIEPHVCKLPIERVKFSADKEWFGLCLIKTPANPMDSTALLCRHTCIDTHARAHTGSRAKTNMWKQCIMASCIMHTRAHCTSTTIIAILITPFWDCVCALFFSIAEMKTKSNTPLIHAKKRKI